MTAHRAFRFCLQYKRTTEFRRLCDIIRNDLVILNKYRDQRDRSDLNVPETLQLYLDTQFEQLKAVIELEIWQIGELSLTYHFDFPYTISSDWHHFIMHEAFLYIEYIHGLMCMVKKTHSPQFMAIYYSKLTKIFWVSEIHLYHGYALYKLYILKKKLE